MTLPTTPKIAIIGLGYVGLPLAVEFGKKYPVTGFDIKQGRIDELKAGRDSTREVEPAELAEATQLSFTANPDHLKTCNIFIVTVPTPVDNAHPQLPRPQRSGIRSPEDRNRIAAASTSRNAGQCRPGAGTESMTASDLHAQIDDRAACLFTAIVQRKVQTWVAIQALEASEGVNALLALIEKQPGLRAPALAREISTSAKNIERWLKQLKDSQHFEFCGAPKTGGYYPSNS